MTGTVPILDALTAAIGEEITLLAGYRITRLSAPFVGEGLVTSAAGTASSVGGTIVTLSSGIFPAGVVAGKRFRVTSGPRSGRSALIGVVNSSTQITLSTSVNDFANESWEVVTDAQETMFVESALDFPTVGSVFCDGIEYNFASRSNIALFGVTRDTTLRPRGYIRCPAQASIPEGTQITFNDGYGNVVKLEFDTDGAVSAGFAGVSLTAGMTATQVRDALHGRLATFESLKILATKIGATDIELWHHETGTQGNVAITVAGAAPNLIVDGMRDGAVAVSGAAKDHAPLAQVVEYTKNYSSVDQFRRGFLLGTSTSTDLDDIGANLAVLRPEGTTTDNVYRQVIAALAYKRKGTRAVVENFLNAALGVGGWEYFEDMTATFVAATNKFPDNVGSHPGVFYVRRTNNSNATFIGKTFLDGSALAVMPSASTITIPSNIDLLYSARLAPDLGYRLVAEGSTTSTTVSISGPTVTCSGAGFPIAVSPGDILELLNGTSIGARFTISSRDASNSLTLGAVEGAAHYTAPTSPITSAAWRVVRLLSSFRRNIPSSELHVEYPGAPATTSTWAFTGVGLTESNVTLSPAPDRYTVLTNNGSNGDELNYFHTARIEPSSRASFEIVSRLAGAPSSSTNHVLQWYFGVYDGSRIIRVGMTHHANHVIVGFLNSTGTGFLSANTRQIDHNPSMLFRTFRIEKFGTSHVELLVVDRDITTGEDHAHLVDRQAYSAFVGTTTDKQLRFGTVKQSGGHSPTMEIKSAAWSIETSTELMNARWTSASTAAGNPTQLTSTGSFIAGDVGRRVRITGFSTRLAAGGTPLGDWQVATYVSANAVTLAGLSRQFAGTIGSQYPRRIYVNHDLQAFTWPDCLGHRIELLSGPNAGLYTISAVLDPVTLTSYSARFPQTIGASSTIPGRQYSYIIEVTSDLPFPADDSIVNWRLMPQFVTDANISFELVNASTLAGTTLTLRQPLASAQLAEIRYTAVPSASLPYLGFQNSEVSPGVFAAYPFYLWDNWGWIRDYIDVVRAAGVKVDIDNFFVDSAGRHIR